MPTDTADEAIVTRLRLLTMRLSRRMRQESGNDAALTPSRYSALSTIESGGPLRMTDLAHTERVSKSSITRIVGSLSDMGHVELVPDPTDGRSTLVQVTAGGKHLLNATSERMDAYLAQQLTEFTAAEKAMLEAAVLLLERLATRSKVRRGLTTAGHRRDP